MKNLKDFQKQSLFVLNSDQMITVKGGGGGNVGNGDPSGG